MSTKIYLTLDLFHYYWHLQECRELWFAVNAHVKATENDIKGWVGKSATGASFEYELVRDPQIFEDTEMATVNLPDDVNFSLVLTDKRSGGNEIYSGKNDRRAGVKIVNGDQFAADNLDVRGAYFEPIQKIPFASAFNLMARDAMCGTSRCEQKKPDELQPRSVEKPGELQPHKVDWNTLRTMIDLTQAGGSRRRLRPGVASNLDAVDLMRLPLTCASEMIVTNIHSMNGLMLRLADRDGIAGLLSVCGGVLTLSDASGMLASFDLAPPEEGNGENFLKRFFSALEDKFCCDQITADLLPDLATRIYLVDTGFTFVHRSYDESHWYRRRREVLSKEEADENHIPKLLASEIRRILIQDRQFEGECLVPTCIECISFELYGNLECTLSPYRDFASDGSGSRVLALTPVPADAEDFYEALMVTSGFFDCAMLIDVEGLRIDKDEDDEEDKGENKVKLIGIFDLAWDVTEPGRRPTILYFGKPLKDGRVSVVFPRTSNGKRIKITAQRVETNNEVKNTTDKDKGCKDEDKDKGCKDEDKDKGCKDEDKDKGCKDEDKDKGCRRRQRQRLQRQR